MSLPLAFTSHSNSQVKRGFRTPFTPSSRLVFFFLLFFGRRVSSTLSTTLHRHTFFISFPVSIINNSNSHPLLLSWHQSISSRTYNNGTCTIQLQPCSFLVPVILTNKVLPRGGTLTKRKMGGRFHFHHPSTFIFEVLFSSMLTLMFFLEFFLPFMTFWKIRTQSYALL